jgi:hypothetical protein
MRDHHAYDIVDKERNRDVVKNGISGQELNKNGTSPRANEQVNDWNKAEGRDRYEAEITHTKIKGRRAAKVIEQEQTNRHHRNGHTLRLHKRPVPQ